MTTASSTALSATASSATAAAVAAGSNGLNDFWRAKVRFYFTEILDFDSDGFISRHDVTLFQQMYQHMKQLTSETPELQRFTVFLRLWFDSMLAATGNQTGSVSVAEFTQYCTMLRGHLIMSREQQAESSQKQQQQQHQTHRSSWPTELAFMSGYIDALFAILDLDGDGVINKHDFVANHAGADDMANREASWSLLSEHDRLSAFGRDAFEQLCVEFLCSTDARDKGNWIFGMFDH